MMSDGSLSDKEITYKLVRSRRRTLSLRVCEDGSLLVRAPLHMPVREIVNFITRKSAWIEKTRSHLLSTSQRADEEGYLTEEDIKDLCCQALEVIPDRVSRFAGLIGVKVGRITIRNQRTRWGSCSSAGNLNFNCLLMLCPPEVLDYVVIHELCHRKYMNHSRLFYAEVERFCPEYRKYQAWLKKEGSVLMERMTGASG